jgi:hypothetical protein
MSVRECGRGEPLGEVRVRERVQIRRLYPDTCPCSSKTTLYERGKCGRGMTVARLVGNATQCRVCARVPVSLRSTLIMPGVLMWATDHISPAACPFVSLEAKH